ncbi:Os02g0468301 [Oryza sativa Japonica Group]|uniref:Os02g0468301 protein n=1 Tax=Oryza sativa subsp. japonica TaxID=39947 RepID=A0A0P0VIW4_ORYSJ|nr:Os02g0468301 [Oryza sativa Japonica Group]
MNTKTTSTYVEGGVDAGGVAGGDLDWRSSLLVRLADAVVGFVGARRGPRCSSSRWVPLCTGARQSFSEDGLRRLRGSACPWPSPLDGALYLMTPMGLAPSTPVLSLHLATLSLAYHLGGHSSTVVARSSKSSAPTTSTIATAMSPTVTSLPNRAPYLCLEPGTASSPRRQRSSATSLATTPGPLRRLPTAPSTRSSCLRRSRRGDTCCWLCVGTAMATTSAMCSSSPWHLISRNIDWAGAKDTR